MREGTGRPRRTRLLGEGDLPGTQNHRVARHSPWTLRITGASDIMIGADLASRFLLCLREICGDPEKNGIGFWNKGSKLKYHFHFKPERIQYPWERRLSRT